MSTWGMTELQHDIWFNKYNFKKRETWDGWLDRISNNNTKIRNRIALKEFLFGGRILSNRQLPEYGIKVTYSNCYVLKPPSDSIYDETGDTDTIWGTAGKMAKTYAYGGGCGTSLRNLRPRGTEVHNNARTTTGAVSFMPLYSLTTETIGQEGRRGALMLSIPSSHPDLPEFIDVKAAQGTITGANISIEVDNQFMEAVKNDQPYLLHFHVEATGEKVERWVNAKELYVKIIKNNLDWAEPGMLYWDTISSYHLMSHHPKFYFAGTNPCAEEPLPPGGSCLLGSINLSEFVERPFTEFAYFNTERFKEAVRDAVVALNEVLDEGLDLHPLEEQRRSVRELRQIGLGVMGIADMLIMLGVRYGDEQSLFICDNIAHMLANEAMQQSALIAKDQGTFEWYDWDYISQSEYFQKVATKETKQLVKLYGLRNSQLLCIAPTGSISTMLGISGGIEPFFSLGYNRTTKSLHGKDVTYWVDEPIVEKYRQATGNQGELPDYFVTAQTLDWHDRVNMQAVWQRYIDASISSTINLPNEASLEDTMDLYMYAWEKGLKGCTIYRDGCKRAGILTLDKPEEADTCVVPDPLDDVLEAAAQLKPQGYFATCPECKAADRGNGNMIFQEGCARCTDCGFSPCS